MTKKVKSIPINDYLIFKMAEKDKEFAQANNMEISLHNISRIAKKFKEYLDEKFGPKEARMAIYKGLVVLKEDMKPKRQSAQVPYFIR